MPNDAPFYPPRTARAKVLANVALGGHVQLDADVGTYVTVDLDSRAIYQFTCEGCGLRAQMDKIDIILDANGPCRHICPVELLEYKEPIH